MIGGRGRRRESFVPSAEVGPDEARHVPVLKVAPDHVRIGPTWAACLVVDGFPAEVSMAWLEPLTSWPGVVDVSLHIEPIPAQAAAARIRRQRVRMESSRRLQADRGDLDDPLMEATSRDAADLAGKVARGESRLFFMSLTLTVHARSREGLAEAVADLQAQAASMLLRTHPLTWRQRQGWQASLPVGASPAGPRRIMDTEALAAASPLSSPDLPAPLPGDLPGGLSGGLNGGPSGDPTGRRALVGPGDRGGDGGGNGREGRGGREGGVLMGLNLASGAVVQADRWSLDNHNMVVLARSGAGKSYAVKLSICRELYQGTRVSVIDPEREYLDLAHRLGGTVIELGAPGVHLNPLELPAGDPDAFTRRCLFVHTLVGVLLGDTLPPGERAVLDEAVRTAYARAGISADPSTWHRPAPHVRDLVAVLEDLAQGPGPGTAVTPDPGVTVHPGPGGHPAGDPDDRADDGVMNPAPGPVSGSRERPDPGRQVAPWPQGPSLPVSGRQGPWPQDRNSGEKVHEDHREQGPGSPVQAPAHRGPEGHGGGHRPEVQGPRDHGPEGPPGPDPDGTGPRGQARVPVPQGPAREFTRDPRPSTGSASGDPFRSRREGAAMEAAASLRARLAPWVTGSFSGLFEGPAQHLADQAASPGEGYEGQAGMVSPAPAVSQTPTVPDGGHLVVWSTRLLAEELRPAGMLLAVDAIWRSVDRRPLPEGGAMGEGRPDRPATASGNPRRIPRRGPHPTAPTAPVVPVSRAGHRQPPQRQLVVVDEASLLLSEPAGVKFLARLAKTSRKRLAGLTLITPDVVDLLGSDLGQVILANSASVLLLRQAPQAIRDLARACALSPGEARFLTRARRGQGLLLAAGRVPIEIVASDLEHEIAGAPPHEVHEPL